MTFWQKLKLVFTDVSLRNRILFVFAILAAFRLLAAIPIPGVDVLRLEQLFAGNQFLGLFNVFSGGGLSNLSIVMLGVGPYITASIILQLLSIMVPKLKQLMHEEGEYGRKKFAQYSRLITIPLALAQAASFIFLFQSQQVLAHLSVFEFVTNMVIITGGSLLLMWFGELITEFGIGNGVSLIIFAGIVSRVPSSLGQLVFSVGASQIPLYLALLVLAILIIAAVVVANEAERPVPVTYAKQVRGMKVYGGVSTHIPLKFTQAGVMPIIFALSILLFPQMIFNFLKTSSVAILQSISEHGLSLWANHWFYGIFYFLLVFIFTYFYTAVTFDPESLATNLQKNGAFIPGVRPGQSTAVYVSKILTRLTLLGALFLGIIAVLPLIIQSITGNNTLLVGGTSLLIVVSVVIDLIKKIEAQVTMMEY